MEKMTFDGLETEFFSEQPIWQDFLDALAEFYQTQVREPMEGLREIRNISADTDPNIVLLTLRDMGIDVPYDLVLSPERLIKSVYMLPLIYQELGKESAWRVIEFILGRHITVQSLWTENYVDFYTEPYGPLRLDGGTWYKTTHVNLGIQMVGSDARIVLPRNKTLKDRLLSAFYSFAPINLVIDKFFFTIDLEKANIAFAGAVSVNPRRVLRFDPSDTLHNYAIVSPDTFEQGDTFQFYLQDNGKDHYHSDWWSDKPGLVVFSNNGTATFGAVDFDTDITVPSRFLGVETTKTVKLKAGFEDIRFIEIAGPDSIDGGTYADYVVRVYHVHGSEEIPVSISLLSPYAKMQFNRLTAEDVTQDEQLGLHAVYIANGVEYTAAKLVTLRHVDQSLSLSDFYVVGIASLQENSSYQFQAVARFSDGSDRNVLALWKSSSSSAYVDNNGNVTIGSVESKTTVTFSASYTFRGVTMTHSVDSTIDVIQNPLVSLAIQGANSVVENARAQYNVLGIFADGSTHVVNAKWECPDFYIGQDGVLEVGTSGVRSREVEITASVGPLNAKFKVLITQEPIVLMGVIIRGPENLHEGVPGNYQALAHYSDGSDQAIMPTWSITGNPSWATISGTGIVNFSDPLDTTLEVRADYLKDGVRYTKTMTVVCTPKSNVITGLIISGPNIVDAGERIVLTATAIYQDGSIDQVTPVWSIYTDDVNAAFVAADIIGSGVVRGRDVDVDMPVVVKARYFQEEVTYPITVRYVAPKSSDIPVASRISGPPVFYANEIASFAQYIKFEHCPDEIAVSSDWALDVPADVAQIDANGFITVQGNRSVTMTVTATFSCGGYTVTDSVVVSSVVQDSKYSTMNLYGPDSMEIGESAQFSAELFSLTDTVVRGGGKFIAADWTILSDSLNIQLSSSGLLRVVGPVVKQSFTIQASFSDGFETIDVTKEVQIANSVPLFGQADIGADNATLLGLPNALDSTKRFSVTVDAGKYGFFCYPIVWGLASFTEVATGNAGGWDGATWPADGSIGTTAGPRTITKTINGINTQWYVYRTNFSGIGTVEFDVTFA
jgi:hypothetical protein